MKSLFPEQPLITEDHSFDSPRGSFSGVTKPEHMADNMMAGSGRLPDAQTRRKMAEYLDTLYARAATTPSLASRTYRERYITLRGPFLYSKT